MVPEIPVCLPEEREFPRADGKITEFEIKKEKKKKKSAKGFHYSRNMNTNTSASMTSLLIKGLGILEAILKSTSEEKRTNFLNVK